MLCNTKFLDFLTFAFAAKSWDKSRIFKFGLRKPPLPIEERVKDRGWIQVEYSICTHYATIKMCKKKIQFLGIEIEG